MANHSLDLPLDDFQTQLEMGNALILKQFARLDQLKGYHDHAPEEVAAWFDEALPQEGMDAEALFALVRDKVMVPATGNLGPHMYAYVMAGGNQMSIIAEQLSATVNQNVGKWHLAPSMSEIEKRVCHWAGEIMGLGPDWAGVMVSGGSAANLTGLTVARNLMFEQLEVRKKGLFGMKPLIVYASTEVHGCVDKSMELLGLGTASLRKIEVDGDFRVDLGAMRRAIEADLAEGLQPFCVVGSAGTVNTGAIDDLTALADLAKEFGLWFHVDGAYGGLAASLPGLRAEYEGMDRADSVAVDFHKWLYQPFEAGCLLVRDFATLRSAYYKRADYLDTDLEGKGRLDFNEHYFQLSRNTKAFKIWMSLKAYGFPAFRDMIQRDIDLTHYLSDQVEASPDFELKSRSHLAVSCFVYTGGLRDAEAITALNQALIPALERDGRVFITGTRLRGEFVIRACLINHRKTEASVDHLLQVIREVGEGISGERN